MVCVHEGLLFYNYAFLSRVIQIERVLDETESFGHNNICMMRDNLSIGQISKLCNNIMLDEKNTPSSEGKV